MLNKSLWVALVSGAGYVSGKEVVSLELANGLREAGYPLEIVVSSWSDGEFTRRLELLGHSYRRMRIGYISATLRFNEMRMTAHQLIYLPALYLSYGRFLREVAPRKIIHTNWHHLLLLLPFLRPTRDLFWVHETIPNKTQYRKLFSTLARRLCCFVVVSHAVRESLIAVGVAPELVYAVHNGLSEFVVGTRSTDQSKIRIGIVGQIVPWKGHEDLCAAYSRLVGTYPNCELHIFGANTGAYFEHLQGLIERWHLDDKVKWHGFEPDQRQIYSKMDICVVPTRSAEPFGLVAVEAAIAGLPCVATKKGGLPEIIDDGVTGLLVEAENPEALASALERLLKNPALRAEMGEAAKQRAKDLFSRDRLVSEFADLLEKC